MICDATMDLGYDNNMLYVLSGKLDSFVSLGYFRGYDASLDPYCIYVADKQPRKIMWNTFFDFSFIFLWHLLY